MGQIESCWNIGSEVRDTMSKHAGGLAECQGPIQDAGHSITTLTNLMPDTRARVLKADPVALKGNMVEVQKYLVKVQDIPQRVGHM